MTVAEEFESRPQLAVPPRPVRPLSTLEMIRVAFANTPTEQKLELMTEAEPAGEPSPQQSGYEPP